MAKSVSILNVTVTNQSLSELVNDISDVLSRERGIFPIASINPEIIIQAKDNPQLARILNSAWKGIPDGVGIMWAAKRMGAPLKERITGVALTKELLKLAQEKHFTIGVMGGTTHSAQRTSAYLRSHYPHLTHWTHPGPWIEETNYEAFTRKLADWFTSKEGKKYTKDLSRTHILFVALGCPKQEYFINQLKITNYELRINRPYIALAIGGTFDTLTGIVPRTPEWIDQAGLRWLFRLLTEPWRLKRQIRLVQFLSLILTKRDSAER